MNAPTDRQAFETPADRMAKLPLRDFDDLAHLPGYPRSEKGIFRMLRVLRDPYSAKPNVLFYTTKRVGGGIQNFDAIKLLKFAAS